MPYAEPDPIDEETVAEPNEVERLAKADRASRAEAAVALRVAGATYTDIMRTLGYVSVTQARHAVEAALAASVGKEDRAQQRVIAGRRIERVLRSLWAKSTDERDPDHLAYARTALVYIDRHIRLYGLDAPTEMVVYSPSTIEIEQWVARATQQLRVDLPDEVDIIEGEVTGEH